MNVASWGIARRNSSSLRSRESDQMPVSTMERASPWPGASHLACALAKQACKNGTKTLCIRMPDMLAYRQERMAAGISEKKVLRKFAGFQVLVVDEWLIDKPTADQMHFLLELTELRYDSSSTICCTQHPHKDWHRRMGGGAHAESVMDHIVHSAVVIEMGDVNMRELTMRKA